VVPRERICENSDLFDCRKELIVALGTERKTENEQDPALRRYFRNLRDTPRAFVESLVRHGRPTSDRAASQAVFTNLFLTSCRRGCTGIRSGFARR
jgi:hypothetical protein